MTVKEIKSKLDNKASFSRYDKTGTSTNINESMTRVESKYESDTHLVIVVVKLNQYDLFKSAFISTQYKENGLYTNEYFKFYNKCTIDFAINKILDGFDE